MAVLQGVILNNNTRGLNVGRLEVSEETVLIAGSGGHTVVANQGLGEDENLAAVGGVGHGLGVANERGGEDGFTRDVGLSTEGLAGEDGSVLDRVSAGRSDTVQDITNLDGEGSPLSRDLCGLSVGGGDLAISVGLDGSQGTRLNAVLCYLSQDIDRPHSGRLDDLRQHIGV